jgi:CBS domain-containing protein
MRAIDIMTSDVITVTEDTSVPEAARLLADRGISAVPVVDSRHLPAWLTAVHLDMYCEQIRPDRLSRRPQTPDQCDAPHDRRKPSMIAALAQKPDENRFPVG